MSVPKSLSVSMAAFILICAIPAAFAAALTKEAAEFIARERFVASVLSNPKTKMEHCRAAEQRAAQFDRDPFYDGLVSECLGGAELSLNNKRQGCDYLVRASAEFRAVPKTHAEYSTAREEISKLSKWRSQIGC